MNPLAHAAARVLVVASAASVPAAALAQEADPRVPDVFVDDPSYDDLAGDESFPAERGEAFEGLDGDADTFDATPLTTEYPEYDPYDGTGRWEVTLGVWGVFASGDARFGDTDSVLAGAFDNFANGDAADFDIDSSLDAVGYLSVDYRRDRLLLEVEYSYGKIDTDGEGNAAGVGGLLDADVQHTWVDLLAGYRVFDGPGFGSDDVSVHLLGGTRLTYLRAQVDGFAVGENAAGAEIGGLFDDGQDEFFADVMVGVAKSYRLRDDLSIKSRALVGGFDIASSSEIQYDVRAGLEYRPTPELGITVGYRVMGLDYEAGTVDDGRFEGQFEYDAFYHGPYLSGGIAF